MVNETYRMAKQAILDAINQRESRCITFVRPSNQGKSHTAHIIARDLGAFIIPVMSISEQRTWFSEHLDNPYFILDDPSDWYRIDDRQHLLGLCKHIITGWLKAGRATKYEYNVPVPLDRKACILFFMNEEQYDMLRMDLRKTGLGARMELYFTRHDKSIMNKILFEYADKKYGSQNLPRFKDNGNVNFNPAFLKSGEQKRYFLEDIEFEDIK